MKVLFFLLHLVLGIGLAGVVSVQLGFAGEEISRLENLIGVDLGTAFGAVGAAVPGEQPDAAEAAAPPVPATTIERPPLLAYNLPRLPEFDETRRRPLFSNTRRPAEAPEAPPAVAPPPLPPPPEVRVPKWELDAVIISGATRAALIDTGRKNGTVRVSEGTSLDAWTLVTLGDDAASFAQGDATFELKLRKFKPLAAPRKAPRARARKKPRAAPRPANPRRAVPTKKPRTPARSTARRSATSSRPKRQPKRNR